MEYSEMCHLWKWKFVRGYMPEARLGLPSRVWFWLWLDFQLGFGWHFQMGFISWQLGLFIKQSWAVLSINSQLFLGIVPGRAAAKNMALALVIGVSLILLFIKVPREEKKKKKNFHKWNQLSIIQTVTWQFQTWPTKMGQVALVDSQRIRVFGSGMILKFTNYDWAHQLTMKLSSWQVGSIWVTSKTSWQTKHGWLQL